MAAANNPILAAPSAADTIHALSTGRPPAAIAIVRLSGPDAGAILSRLIGPLPPPRRASVRTVRDAAGEPIDHALILWFPGPETVTGEDLAELHLHGGRAVVAAASETLTAAGARPAEAGEFTRRALYNGRLDLDAVEGLADLLAAETDYQRREALRRTDGALGRRLAGWSSELLGIAARIEAAIDYDGEADVADGPEAPIDDAIRALAAEIGDALRRVSAARLRDGLRIAIVGPPNAGKSSLFNAIVGQDAAIVSSIAGTTRDAIERPIALGGMPFILVDTAGQRETIDEIERIGVGRARQEQARADIVLDLVGSAVPGRTLAIAAKADLIAPRDGALPVSAITEKGMPALIDAIVAIAATLLPPEGDVALDQRYRDCLRRVQDELNDALEVGEAILQAEHIRRARDWLDGVTGGAGIEDMLDALFGRFCLGK